MIKKLIPNKKNSDPPDEKSTNGALPETIDRAPLISQPQRDWDYHKNRLQDMMGIDSPDLLPKSAASDDRLVHVGPGVAFEGTIGHCTKVVIEGDVKATIVADRLLIRAQGTFNGRAEVAEAEIDGNYQGTLTAQKKLSISNTGIVNGDISYAELEIVAGGLLTGDVSVFIPEEGEGRRTASSGEPLLREMGNADPVSVVEDDGDEDDGDIADVVEGEAS
jgi:cytoskeletal protein CcmA (bactofilin family)